MSERPTDVINAAIALVGLDRPVSKAEWGRLFADALLGLGDDDAIRYALADAGEKYRSGYSTKTKSRAKHMAAAAMRGQAQLSDVLATQLAFEVSFEGVAPRPMALVDNAFLREAVAYAERQYQGHLQNLSTLKHVEYATRPYPGRTVGDLIAAGLLSLSDVSLADAA